MEGRHVAVPPYLLKNFEMKMIRFHASSVLCVAMYLTACKPLVTPVPTVTPTPDPCAQGNIGAKVKKVNDLMRAFDDASLLTSNTPREQLVPAISNMQTIRRTAEDQSIPACLTRLKALQLAHMNTVIETFISFNGGADMSTLNNKIALARQQHDAYAIELARLLGVTIVPVTAVPFPIETPTIATP
jgi:hypothetical protein